MLLVATSELVLVSVAREWRSGVFARRDFDKWFYIWLSIVWPGREESEDETFRTVKLWHLADETWNVFFFHLSSERVILDL